MQRCSPRRGRAEAVRSSATRRLVADPFGNYVVQYILDLKQPALTLQVARALEGSLAELSLQKFSSNVIEKCLTWRAAGRGRRARLRGSSLHDPFANYVVQTLNVIPPSTPSSF